MAFAVFHVFRATLAVTVCSVLLSACGGGGGGGSVSSPVVTPQPVQPGPAASAPIFGATVVDQGTSFDGRPRKQTLVVAQSQGKPDIQFSYVPTAAKTSAKTALAAVRTAPSGAVMATAQIFTEAEKAFPTLFSPAHGELGVGSHGGRTYRFWCYAGTGNCLGEVIGSSNATEIGEIHGVGPFTGNQTVRFETAAYWSCVFEPARCGPRLVGAKVINMAGATLADLLVANPPSVPAKAIRLVLTYHEALDCADVGGTSVVGGILITTSCARETLTFTPGQPGEERWPFGTTNTLTVSGLRNVDGYPSVPTDIVFTTEYFSSDLVFVGNALADETNGAAVSLIYGDGVQRQIKLPGLFLQGNLALSRTVGITYVASRAAQAVARLDGTTGVVLRSLEIESNSPIAHGIMGVATSEREGCVVLGHPGGQAEYSWRNRFMCWNHFTQERVFQSPTDWVTDATKIPLALHYSTLHRRYYVLNATERALLGDEKPLPGLPGTVTEVSCEDYPCQVTRTFLVGSVPQGITEDETGALFVVNSGDRSLSVIQPVNGNVVTRGLTMFTGAQFPATIHHSSGRLLMSDYKRSIVVLNRSTFNQIERIQTEDLPWGMATVGTEIWVSLPCAYLGALINCPAGNKVLVIDGASLAPKRIISSVGPSPTVILSAR